MKPTTETIAVITLGCAKNTVDSEILLRQLDAHNLRVVDDPADSDIVIINTCGFIDAAKEESINTILEASELKKNGRTKKLYVAGCLSERYRDELTESLPEVDRYFGVTDFDAILQTLGMNFKRELLGERHLTTPSHTAYLKISEGCDHPCSFCAIPMMRGGHISRTLEDILGEARYLAGLGVKELVVIAQDTTFYGRDRYGEKRLAALLRGLSEVNGIEWIRLMYAFPSHFPMDVLDVMQDRPNICNYIDMPVQHASDDVLRSMRRGITRHATEELIARMRTAIQNLTLRTTLIVGYPNETERAFEELRSFVATMRFDRLGVFSYSAEEQTTAAILGDPVPMDIKEQRRAEIMELQAGISQELNVKKIGQTLRVLLDRLEGDFVVGRTEADAPEVDNEVLIHRKGFSESPLIGSFVPVTITEATDFDLLGYPVELP